MYSPIGLENQIPTALLRGAKASVQASKGNFVCVDSTGLASENDGTVADQLCVGIAYPSEKSDLGATDGAAQVRVNQRFCSGLPASAETNDGFTDADWCVPFYIAGKATPGKLATFGGHKRTIGGLVFGLDPDGSGTPVLWPGAIPSLLARLMLSGGVMPDGGTVGAWVTKAVDGSASATTAEVIMARLPVQGKVKAIKFTSLAATANDATDIATIIVYKADGAGGTHVELGRLATTTGAQGAIVAGVPKLFALSSVAGALDLLATDIVSSEITKGASGKVIGAGTIEVIQQTI